MAPREETKEFAFYIVASKESIKSDLARLDRTKDANTDYSDIPLLEKEFFKKAPVPWATELIFDDEDANDWGWRLHTLKIMFASYIELWRGTS